MSVSTMSASQSKIIYPESDGQPMADNGIQFRWIVTLAANLAALFRARPDVLVAGNQFWYPVEGEPDLRAAPDVYVVFGRPKGDRPSYKQWEEDGVPMTVVFEILSPSNTGTEMADKYAFYDEYGAEEYYLYDPDANRLHGFVRRGEVLVRVRQIGDFVSPRLGIRFDLSGPEMVVRYPDGRPFLAVEELAEAEEQARLRVGQERQRAARMAALMARALQQQATPDELQELQQLIEEASRPAP